MDDNFFWLQKTTYYYNKLLPCNYLGIRQKEEVSEEQADPESDSLFRENDFP